MTERSGGSGVRILVTGGGTGGHVSPALAVIQTLRAIAGEPNTAFSPTFLYVGSEAGVEKRLAAEQNIAFVGVQTGKLRRYASVQNVVDLFKVPVGMVQALRAVRRFRPDVVFSTGGYVSVPPTWAAGLLRVPILVHEQTVQVGLATRLNARWATKIALSFEGAQNELPAGQREKTFVSGNPVRQVIFNGDRVRAIKRFGFAAQDDNLPCVYVTGGAQGSRIINRAVEGCLSELLGVARVVHQCGQQPTGSEQDFDRLSAAKAHLPPHLARRYHVSHFVGDEIGDVFALADLLVARSGAGTVTEACALGKPAVFVPLVPTRGDEQTRNAQRSVDAGGAVILPQAECDGPHLLAVVRPLLADPARLQAMGRAAQTLARPNAARDLAQALLHLASR